MATHRGYHHKGCRGFGVLAGFFLILLSWTGAWSQGKELQARSIRQRSPEQRLSVTVHQGQLSADVRGADVGELLAQIGRQAGIRMLVAPSARRQISAQLAGIELDEALRHLFRLASLNHTILYVREPGGMVAIKEVRVFGEETGGASVPPLTGMRARNEPSPEDTIQHAAATPAQDSSNEGETQEDAPDASQ
jgi:hypothetical protein